MVCYINKYKLLLRAVYNNYYCATQLNQKKTLIKFSLSYFTWCQACEYEGQGRRYVSACRSWPHSQGRVCGHSSASSSGSTWYTSAKIHPPPSRSSPTATGPINNNSTLNTRVEQV